MMKVLASLGIVFVLSMAVASRYPEEKAVRITDQGFMPERIDVTVGEKVVWTNGSQKEHTVTARTKAPSAVEQERKDQPIFDSGPIQPGASWSHSFDKEGTYDYFCTKDKGMAGTIVVKPAK